LHTYGIHSCATPYCFTIPTQRTIFGREEDDTAAMAHEPPIPSGVGKWFYHTHHHLELTLSTEVPPHLNTGLSAVIIGNVEDWCIYCSIEASLISELAGNSSGFDLGAPIGGMSQNGSSIAAVNVNSTTNNISFFLIDQLTQTLFGIGMHLTDGAWTSRTSPPH
jgi:hypothetical protein